SDPAHLGRGEWQRGDTDQRERCAGSLGHGHRMWQRMFGEVGAVEGDGDMANVRVWFHGNWDHWVELRDTTHHDEGCYGGAVRDNHQHASRFDERLTACHPEADRDTPQRSEDDAVDG